MLCQQFVVGSISPNGRALLAARYCKTCLMHHFATRNRVLGRVFEVQARADSVLCVLLVGRAGKRAHCRSSGPWDVIRPRKEGRLMDFHIPGLSQQGGTPCALCFMFHEYSGSRLRVRSRFYSSKQNHGKCYLIIRIHKFYYTWLENDHCRAFFFSGPSSSSSLSSA